MGTDHTLKDSGFTLIEMALVLVVVGLLVSMGVQLLPMLINQNKLMETRSRVTEAKTALIGYALANNKLPHASITDDGTEDNVNEGFLPYVTLGLPKTDPYSRTLRYAVDPYLTDGSAGVFTDKLQDLMNGDQPPHLFCRDDRDPAHVATIPKAFVVISTGKNLVLDPPYNNDTDDIYAAAENPQTNTYDDIVAEFGSAALRGRFN